jgi:hypothetical protein
MLIDGRGKSFSLPFLLLQHSVETLFGNVEEQRAITSL